MRNFSNYHDRGHRDDCSDLWHIHYLLVLALGKAFVVRVGQDRRPPGADLYVQAMKLLPDTTYLCKDPIPSMEILCCAALYLQCLDMRSTAYSLVSFMSLSGTTLLLLTCVADWSSLTHGRGARHTHGHSKSASLRTSHGEVPRDLVDRVCARLSSVLSDGHTACSGRAGHQRAAAIFRRLLTKNSGLIYPC